MKDFPHAIRFWADFSESGYGMAARGLLRCFEALGLSRKQIRCTPAVGAVPQATKIDEGDWVYQDYFTAQEEWNFVHSDPRSDGSVVEVYQRAEPTTGINLVHVHPPALGRFWAANWYNIAYCAWETNKLPTSTFRGAGLKDETVVETINAHYDELWTPTPRVAEAFRIAGVTRPVFVVPHALQTELLKLPPREEGPFPQERHPYLFAEGDERRGDVVNFYYVGSWDERKNVAALLKAYWTTGWTPADPVRLTLHCTPSDKSRPAVEAHAMRAQDEYGALLQSLANPQDAPSCGLNIVARSYNWICDLHRMNHVFITASRGEGFCLPALEALAMGNPVVGGREALNHLVDTAGVFQLETNPREVDPMPEVVGYEMGQMWRDVSVEALRQGFHAAFAEARKGVLQVDAQAVRKSYSPQTIGETFVRPRLQAAADVLAESGW